MKIKRLCAANIRDAMRKVREELGSDAVILSNERTSAGFEIVAAVDYDEKLLQGMQQTVATEAAAQRRTLARDSTLPEDDKPDLCETRREVDPPTSAPPRSSGRRNCRRGKQWQSAGGLVARSVAGRNAP
jgi:flagellar biosynthesis protein FlhF